MNIPAILQQRHNWPSLLIILFAFFLPLSTSISSLLGILIILACVCSRKFTKALPTLLRNPVVVCVLLYILLHIIGLLWTDDIDWGIKILKKQWKLLLLPLLIPLIKKEHIQWYMTAFVLSLTLLSGKNFLVWLGLLPMPAGGIFITRGTFHVVFNPLLAWAIYLVLHQILFASLSRRLLLLHIFLFLFLSFGMFITVGRTGQIAFFMLIAISFFQYFKTIIKASCLALLTIPLLITTLYMTNTTFQDRVDTGINEVKNFRSQKITSLGCRVWFCSNTLTMIQQHPLYGVGTGDFPDEYAKINKIHSPHMVATDNPHNQYFLVLAQFGGAGIISLILIFASQQLVSFKIQDSLSHIRLAFTLFFLTIMLGESYLLVYETGFLFSLFSAFLYQDFTDKSENL